MKRVAMRKIRDVLRLHDQGMSARQIATSLAVGRTAVREYLSRARSAGLSWPLPEGLDDEALEARLYPRKTGRDRTSFVLPDWAHLHRELRRKGVTLALLWDEYRAVHRDGYGYSRFCELYKRWEGTLSPVMRQRHVAGEQMFVDYAGTTLDVVCPKTGEVMAAQLFVATLGASNYTHVEASWTQSLPDWTASHVRALEFFGGVPAQIVPDNLKSAVIKACLYEPEINRTYADLATHYDTAILPTRPRKPKDKAKVEAAVLLATRWITARLRNNTFFSLDELNAAIGPLRDQLNAKPSRHLGASRQQLFEELDKPALKPLPVEPYVYAEWKECRVGLDYHIDVGRHYYSVPYQLLKQKIWVRITSRTIEAFCKGKRVAAHARISGNYQHSTLSDHMPANHRFRADWTPERMRKQAARIGPNTEALIEVILRERRHPEQGFRSCLGILRLAKSYGADRLEAACERALEINARSYTSVKSILQNHLDRRSREPVTDGPAIIHSNIRGADYFH